MIEITTIEEYEFAVLQDFEPLIDTRFHLEIELRRETQKTLFKGDINKYYRWCFYHSKKFCEECSQLLEYSARHVSHILSKQAHPAMKFDPRNKNILCFFHHRKWEYGERKQMKIYEPNQLIIQTLNKEYYAQQSNSNREFRQRCRDEKSRGSECNESQRRDDGEVADR